MWGCALCLRLPPLRAPSTASTATAAAQCVPHLRHYSRSLL